MTSALIELRSCERFAVLAEYCTDVELAKLYKGLWASEHGHYRTFINLAEHLPGVQDDAAAARWAQLLDSEAAIIARQPVACTIHSGVNPG
jgi:tRNA-(ms[2]io[6]A)-hydroxylase